MLLVTENSSHLPEWAQVLTLVFDASRVVRGVHALKKIRGGERIFKAQMLDCIKIKVTVSHKTHHG